MYRICAWCHDGLNMEDTPLQDDAPITHGVCEECMVRLLTSSTQTMENFLDCYAEPILLLDGSGKVLAANEAASDRLHRKRDAMLDQYPGNLVECAHARLPGGCGRTVHCRTCTIRSVLNAAKTGCSQRRVPAIADHGEDGESGMTRFLISADRMGDTILLRIDEMQS